MRKSILKIVLLIIIMLLGLLATNSFAASTLKVGFQQGYSARAGETIEIPIILSDVNMDGIQKGIIDFTCNVNIDDAFELVKEGDSYVKVNQEFSNYIELRFNKNSKKLIFNVLSQFFTEKGSSLKSYVKVGTMKIKVKEDTVPGEYYISIQNVIGENGEQAIYGTGVSTKVRVVAPKETNETQVTTIQSTNGETKTFATGNEKGAKLDIQKSEDGSIVTITPDEVNGAIIGRLLVNGKEVVKSNGKYIVRTEFGDTLDIVVYGIDGTYLSSINYMVINDTVYTNDFDTNNEQNGNGQGNQNQGQNNNNQGATDGTNKDGNKGTSNGGLTPESNQNGSKTTGGTTNGSNEDAGIIMPTKTGDYIIIAIGTLLVAIFALFIVKTIKNMKNKI